MVLKRKGISLSKKQPKLVRKLLSNAITVSQASSRRVSQSASNRLSKLKVCRNFEYGWMLYQTLFIQGLAAEVAKSLSRRKSRRVNYRDLYKIGKPYVKTIRKKIGKS